MRLLWLGVAALALLPNVPQQPAMKLQPLHDLIRTFEGVAGLSARDLRTGAEVAINADERFPSASAIKVAVMVEAYHQHASGALPLDTRLTLREAEKVGGSGVLGGMSPGLALEIRDLIHLMIVVSDNTATNMLVERLGTKRIDERLESYGLRFTKIFRPTFRDGRPDIHPELERQFGLGMATPREMATLMALIAKGGAVDRDASAAMLATLRRQHDRTMIPRLLPESIRTGNKTGTDSEKLPDAQGRRGAIRTDAAIISGEGVHYVIAIFTRHGRDTRSGPDNAGVLLGARLSRMVFDLFAPAQNNRPPS